MRKVMSRSTRKLYGYAHQGRPLEIVAARVEVVGRTGRGRRLPRRVAAHEAVAGGYRRNMV